MCARMCVRHALFLPACCSTRTLDRPANALLGSNNLYGAVPAAVAALLPATGPSWSATCVTNASAPLSYCGMPELTPLLDLYVATGGGDWLANVNWLVAGSSPCTWSGIACGTTSGPVMCVWGSGCSLFPVDAVMMLGGSFCRYNLLVLRCWDTRCGPMGQMLFRKAQSRACSCRCCGVATQRSVPGFGRPSWHPTEQYQRLDLTAVRT